MMGCLDEPKQIIGGFLNNFNKFEELLFLIRIPNQ